MKEELYNEVLDKVTDAGFDDGACWTPSDIRLAIDLAYNRGIDDAAEAVKLEVASGRCSDPNVKFKLVEEVTNYQQGHGERFYDAVRVNKSSILNLRIQ